ncbi:MAG TPA: EF-P lysine aminoacylase EpmA [Stellaceae bacterium]|jgi:lysyl-tRNA synthetase class 2|nr:EF-P lysine aminoacylase EpmA [Stellaceae bacterium]
MERGRRWWHPEEFQRRRPCLEGRARILAALRRWFEDHGFLEVETPALQVSPGLEPHLVAFATTLIGPEGDRTTRYLHTSPEFAMKKLLVAGLPAIFQFAHVFRNAERATIHSPEFTMLEWYRAEAQYETLMVDCEALLRLACTAAGADRLRGRGHEADPFQPFERLSVADAFQRHAGIDILATTPNPAGPSLDMLAAQSTAIGIAPHQGDSWEDLFFRIMLERIEPHLGMGRPTLLCDYPVSMAALARPKPSDPRVAERFELYACGIELANAFGELTDADVQRARFEADMDLKQRLYGERYPIDEDFLAALAHGMPASAGIALGVDRLVLLATGAEHIEDVLWAPV